MVEYRERAGFGMVDLLVVIALIVVLAGLMMPAIQMSRARAQRVQCASNLRQIAGAVHTYLDEHNRFPYNTFQGVFGEGPDCHAWSWLARVVPYVDSGASIEPDFMRDTLRESSTAQQAVSSFICPADPSLAGPRLDAGNLRGVPVGQTSYKGVSGANWGDDLQGDGGPNFRTHWRNASANGSFDGHSSGDGIFYRLDYQRLMRLEFISNGISNTFMIGEDICRATAWCSWPYANNANGTCAIPPNVEWSNGRHYSPMNWENNESFRSAHGGGLHFAYADGSVHFISDSIDLLVYRAMATIVGGETVIAPD